MTFKEYKSVSRLALSRDLRRIARRPVKSPTNKYDLLLYHEKALKDAEDKFIKGDYGEGPFGGICRYHGDKIRVLEKKLGIEVIVECKY